MASDSFDVRVPSQSVMKHITMNVKVTGLHVWKARLTVGCWLMKLAARVMGVHVHVDLETNNAR